MKDSFLYLKGSTGHSCTAELTADSSFILMFSYCDISVYTSPQIFCPYGVKALQLR
jgi:hypothetical protein